MKAASILMSGFLLGGSLTPAFAGEPLATTGKASQSMKPAQIRGEVRALRRAQPALKRVLSAQAADPHISSVLGHSQFDGNYYIVSDLHFGIGRARPNGPFDPQEDFTRGDVWQRTLAYIGKQPGKSTLVIGGDGLDILEHVNPEEGLEKVSDTIGQMVRGHAAEWKALARAVGNDGLRVVYIRGNHDIRLVDSSGVAHDGTPIRQRFLDEVMKVGDLTSDERQLFSERVAFSGHAAPLGKFGELLVYHGEQQDPTNSWRNPANPYSYTKNGQRIIPRTLGDHIVRDEWVGAEKADPNGDNDDASATKVVAERILTNRKALGNAAKLLWAVSRHRVETGPAQRLAERIDDRLTLQQWAERTGFDRMMSSSPTGRPAVERTPREIAKQLERIYGNQPQPIQERMKSRFHGVNVANELFGKDRLSLQTSHAAEPAFLHDLTSSMPNVRYVVAGHDHAERIRIGTMADRGDVGFFDSGTWTKTHGEDRLDVVVAHTDAAGRVMAPRLFRVNPTTGTPELPPRAFDEPRGVEGWSQVPR